MQFNTRQEQVGGLKFAAMIYKVIVALSLLLH